MGTPKDPLYRKTVEKQYEEWFSHCRTRLDRMESELPPPRVDLREELASQGVSRRDFIKWTSLTTALLMLPPVFKPLVARAAEQFSRLPVVWLHFAECTGCSEALLRTSYPNTDSILLDTISLEYHETLMAAAGHQAEQNLEKALADFGGKLVCVIEGGVPRGLDGKYLTLGAKGKTGIVLAKEVASKSAAVICIGTCSSYGGVQAAKPNPTDAVGIAEAIGIRTVNIPGCPPNPANFVGTVLHFLLFGGLPALDALGRPVWAYGARIHDYCERRPHYDAAEFVEEWGDAGAAKGWCLYKKGCKGPYTYANCGKVRFNDAVSWPIMAGHGCIGCTEPHFWDTMKPFEKPIDEKTIGSGEKTVDTVGKVLLAATVAGIGVHAGLTAIRHRGNDNADETSHKA